MRNMAAYCSASFWWALHVLLRFHLIASLIIALWLQGSTALFGNRTRLLVKPSDPLVQTGHALLMNCTIGENYSGPYNSSDLYFKFMQQMYRGETYLTVLDERTAEFRLENMSRSMSGKHCYCYLPDDDVIVGHQVITVADPPVVPYNISCVVYNWESMVCTWLPESQDTGIQTTQEMHWTLLHDCSKTSRCPHKGRNNTSRCEWRHIDEKDSLKLTHEYTLCVIANNTLRTVSADGTKVRPAEEVKPNNVTDLRQTGRTSRSLNITWNPPSPSDTHRVHYEIRVIPGRGEEWMLNTTNEPFVFLDDLSPDVNYTVMVRSIPLIEEKLKGHWSGYTRNTFRTDQDVPEANPIFFPSYQVEPDGQEMWEVTTYWQEIPVEQRSGTITQYMLMFEPLTEGDRVRDETAPGVQFFQSKTLKREVMYRVTITAYTEKGFNSDINGSSIYIPADSDAFGEREVSFTSVSTNEKQVMFNWTEIEDAESYLLLFCISKNNIRPECKSGVQWVNIPANETSYFLSLSEEYGEYHFAMAVTKKMSIPQHRGKRSTNSDVLASGGIKWSRCVPSTEDELKAPSEVKFSEQQVGGSISLSWERPDCVTGGFIEQFIITYWIVNDREATEKEAVVGFHTQSYVLRDVQEEATYAVEVKSYSPFTGKESDPVAPPDKEITVMIVGLAKWGIALVVIASLITIIFVPFGVIYCYRKSKKKYRQNMDLGLNVPGRGTMISTQAGGQVNDYADEADTQLLQETSAMNRANENDVNYGLENGHGRDNIGDYPQLNTVPYMNGGLSVAFSKTKQSVSISSTETLTTPLPSDTSMDADDVFEHNSTRKLRHTSGKGGDLLPVAEESSGLSDNGDVARRKRSDPTKTAADTYYNEHDSDGSRTPIDGYNQIGLGNPDAQFVQLPGSDYHMPQDLIQCWKNADGGREVQQSQGVYTSDPNQSALSSIDPYTTVDVDMDDSDQHYALPDLPQGTSDVDSFTDDHSWSNPGEGISGGPLASFQQHPNEDIANYSSLASEGPSAGLPVPTVRDMQYILQQKPLPVNRKEATVDPRTVGSMTGSDTQSAAALKSSPSSSFERISPHSSNATQHQMQAVPPGAFDGLASPVAAVHGRTSGGHVLVNPPRQPVALPAVTIHNSAVPPPPPETAHSPLAGGKNMVSVPLNSNDYVEAPLTNSPIQLNPSSQHRSVDDPRGRSQPSGRTDDGNNAPKDCQCHENVAASQAICSPNQQVPCRSCAQSFSGPNRDSVDRIVGNLTNADSSHLGSGSGGTSSGSSSQTLTPDSGPTTQVHNNSDNIPTGYVDHEDFSPSHTTVPVPQSSTVPPTSNCASPLHTVGDYVQAPSDGNMPSASNDYVTYGACEVPVNDYCEVSQNEASSSADAAIESVPANDLTALHRKTDTGRLPNTADVDPPKLTENQVHDNTGYVVQPSSLPQSAQSSGGYVSLDSHNASIQQSAVPFVMEMDSDVSDSDGERGNAQGPPAGQPTGSSSTGDSGSSGDQVTVEMCLTSDSDVPYADETTPQPQPTTSPSGDAGLPGDCISLAINYSAQKDRALTVNGYCEPPTKSITDDSEDSCATHPLLPSTREPNNNCNKQKSHLLSSSLLKEKKSSDSSKQYGRF